MTTKEKLHQWIDALPDEKAESVFQTLHDTFDDKDDTDTSIRRKFARPSDLLKFHGIWEDDRTTEEIIQDIHANRRNSTRNIEL